MEKRNKIIALILSLLMLFSNILNVFAFDFEVPIINGDEVILDNDNSSLIDNTVIINGSENNIVTENTTNTTINNNSNIEENKINETKLTSKEVLEENVLTKNGRIVKAKINPIGFNENSRQLKTFTLVGRDKGADATVSFKGDEKGAKPHALIDYITRHNGDEASVGYCISPFYAGAKENGTTTVTEVVPSIADKILIGIAVAGYPNNKYNIAGLSSLTEEEQYYATLIAMEHFIFQKTGEYKNKKGVQFNDDSFKSTRWYPTRKGDANAQKIIDIAKQIYAQGVANPYDETKGIATVNFKDNYQTDGTMKPLGDKYNLTLTLTSDIPYSHAILQFENPKIKEWATQGNIAFYDGESTAGRKLEYKTNPIAGENYDGVLLEKTSRKSDKLTILLDKATADNAITDGTEKYNVDYDVKFFGGNMQVGYRTRNNDNSLQDYVIITTGNATARSSINWSKVPEPPDRPIEKSKGGLKILKYNAKTNELVSGAIFRVRGISQDVYDFNLQIQASNGAEIPLPNGGVATCRNGVIELKNINVGTYEITDIDKAIRCQKQKTL